MSDWVVVGKFLGPYGVKGWVKLYSYTHPIENIGNFKSLWIQRDGQWQPTRLLKVQRHGKGLIAQVEGCDRREEVPQYSGLMLAVERSQLPKLEQDDFYWSELEGLQVINLAGECLGKVDHLLETGANDVLVVVPCAGSIDDNERLVPYLWEQVIQHVDLASGQIRVDWGSDFG